MPQSPISEIGSRTLYLKDAQMTDKFWITHNMQTHVDIYRQRNNYKKSWNQPYNISLLDLTDNK